MTAGTVTTCGAGVVESDLGWLRLHQRFMPDYNRKASVYWWTVVLLGVIVEFFVRALLRIKAAW